MTDDDTFRPKLGKIRSLGGKRAKSYVNRIVRAVSFAGGRGNKKGFTGRRYGRGAGVGSLLAGRDGFGGLRHRRVIVKSRIAKLKAGGTAAAAHLRYIQRDGVSREGEPGGLYGKETGPADGKEFLGRCEGDRHQFRLIIASEDGDQYAELQPFVDHFNTGHPHSHVVLRGKDDRGNDLIIARDYMSRGMRERASEIVTLDLGPRTDQEIELRLTREIDQERFTGLDRRLLKDKDEGRVVRLLKSLSPLQQTLRAGRLKKLERMGLAEEVVPGIWRLDENLEDRLRELGTRGDIIKTMHRDLRETGSERPASDLTIYDPKQDRERPLVGRVVAAGLHDEISDRRYLIVEGTDGFAHYVDTGEQREDQRVSVGQIVSIAPLATAAKEMDHTVAEIAVRHGERYSAEIHRGEDRSAGADFVETHVRRLEAIRKLAGGVTREADGSWTIAPDHVSRAEAYERGRARRTPVVVSALSHIGLDQQVRADGATWLDGELVRSDPEPMRDSGFGREARQALQRRRQWLMEQGLAHEEENRVIYRANLLIVLRRREVVRMGAALAKELGLSYRDPQRGERIDGIYRRPVDLVSGRYAAIETRAKDLVLVPWRPVLDRSLKREVSGVVRDAGISWSIGRQRPGPER
jgi:type IV secretory pathway VirD2 relaxase